MDEIATYNSDVMTSTEEMTIDNRLEIIDEGIRKNIWHDLMKWRSLRLEIYLLLKMN